MKGNFWRKSSHSGLLIAVLFSLFSVAACHGNNLQYPVMQSPASKGTPAGESANGSHPVTPQPTQQPQEHSAEPVKPSVVYSDVTAPAGIFVSSGPTVSDRVLGQGHVKGNLIRVGWDQIQPAPGNYDFSAIDALISQAEKHQKQVTLSVLNGPRAPQWLYDQGAKAFNYEFKNRYSGRGNRQEVIPLPWDAVYLEHWAKLIAKLGQRYAGNKTIALVHITHASKNGFEMQLPEERVGRMPETASQGPWHDAGYSVDKHVAAVTRIIDQFATAFPNTPLDIEIHPVLDSLEPARRIYEYGIKRYGKRFGLFSAWWSGMSQPWNAGLYPLLQAACESSFCNIQMIGNQTKQPERLLDGSLLNAMHAAQKLGARYFEVWSADLANTALQNDLATFSRTLKQD